MKCKSLLLISLITLYLLIGASLFALIEQEPQVPATPLSGPMLRHARLLKQIAAEFPEANQTLLLAALGIPLPQQRYVQGSQAEGSQTEGSQVIAEARVAVPSTDNETTYTTETAIPDASPLLVQLPYGVRFIYWFSYSVSLLTTIGYGDVYPRTPGGKALTILYGCIGIPFIFVCLIKLGLMFRQTTRGLLNKVARRVEALDSLFKRRGYFPVEFPLHLTLYVVLIVLVPSAIFYSVEGWSYGDSVYFSFISLTTVGFGDLLNNQPHLGFPLRKVLLYKVLTKAWLFSGLVWHACILSILWNKLTSFTIFRGFMVSSRPAKSIVEEIPLGNGHGAGGREESIGEEEKLNTCSEQEKLKLDAEA